MCKFHIRIYLFIHIFSLLNVSLCYSLFFKNNLVNALKCYNKRVIYRHLYWLGSAYEYRFTQQT